MYVCLQMRKREKRDILVTYYVPNDLGGYQPEHKPFYIDKLEILKRISRPQRKKIGRSRATFLFHDL